MKKLSLERIITTLVETGLTRMQAEVYVYLAKKGPKTLENLTKTLIFDRKQVKKSLNCLQKKGLLTKNKILFCALPFEEALILLIETKKEQAKVMKISKKEIALNMKSKKR